MLDGAFRLLFTMNYAPVRAAGEEKALPFRQK
jgi:hypothetical protein